MSELEPNSPVQLSEPPVPKARPPLRRFSVIKQNSLSSSKNFNSASSPVKEKMHKINVQNKKLLDPLNDEISSDNDDENDDVSDDDSDTSQGLILKCASSARTTPVTRRYSRSPNTSYSLNDTNNTSFSFKQPQIPTKGNLFQECICVILCSIAFVIVGTIILTTQVLHYEEKDQAAITENEKVEKNDTKILDLVQVDKMLDTSMQIIRTRFYNQKPYIWNDISSGIYDIALYPEKPVVIILFGNETNTLSCLAQLLGQLSGTILGSNDYLSLTSKDFPDDVGRTVYNLRVHILQKRAVIVQDLLSINAEAIKAFHNFCDRENPLIGQAIYILTVIVDGYKPSQRGVEFIEKHITKKLSGKIEKDILDPLVTRLTDGIIVPVFPESAANFNHAKCSFPAQHKL